MNATVSTPENPADGDFAIRYNPVSFDLYKIVKTFIDSGLHQTPFVVVHDVFAVAECVINSNTHTLIAQNTRGIVHAEECLIRELKTLFDKHTYTIIILKIWINFSPCDVCSAAIIDLLGNYPIVVEIYFPCLHKIRRPSCRDRGCTHHLPSVQRHTEIVKGLKRLKRWGVLLKPFEASVWQELVDFFGIQYRGLNIRTEEDTFLKKDFMQIMRR